MIRQQRRTRRRRKQAGFTLVELMISLVMFSFAIAGVLAVAVSMANGFREQRASVGTETAARAAMEFLGDSIRGVSPGVESGLIWPMDDNTCTLAKARVFNVTMGNSSAPDDFTMTFAYGSVVATSLTAYIPSSTSITVDDASQFSAGDFFVITDFTNAAIVRISAVSGNTLSYNASSCSGSPITTMAAGALVVRSLRARFYIANIPGAGTPISALYMDPDPLTPNDEEPLAEGIEDMQIAVGVDAGGNGLDPEVPTVTNGDEWTGNAVNETLPNPIPNDATGKFYVRGVRISVVAKALSPVTGQTAQNPYVRPALEDRSAGTPDKFRRRILTSVIEIRNLSVAK